MELETKGIRSKLSDDEVILWDELVSSAESLLDSVVHRGWFNPYYGDTRISEKAYDHLRRVLVKIKEIE